MKDFLCCNKFLPGQISQVLAHVVLNYFILLHLYSTLEILIRFICTNHRIMAGTSSLKCACVEESENFTMASLIQFYVKIVRPQDEVKYLMTYLSVLDYKQVVVYVRDPIRSTFLSEILEEEGFSCTFVHEHMSAKYRRGRLAMFKENEDSIKILVTSCSSHAKEFDNVDVIFMFDEVENSLLYNHRISSKTAKKGLVINFIRNDAHMEVIKQVEKQHNTNIPKLPDHLYTSSYMTV